MAKRVSFKQTTASKRTNGKRESITVRREDELIADVSDVNKEPAGKSKNAKAKPVRDGYGN